MPSKNSFSYPFSPTLRTALENHLLLQRIDNTQDDIRNMGTRNALSDIHLFGREAIDEMSDIRLQDSLAGETVSGVGQVPIPDWGRMGYCREGQFLHSTDLFFAIALSPDILLSVFSARHRRFMATTGKDLVALSEGRRRPLIRVGVGRAK